MLKTMGVYTAWLAVALGLPAALATKAGAAETPATVAPATVATAPTGGVRVQSDVVWRTVDGEQLTLDAFVPERAEKSRPAVVLIHGGGWRAGTKANFDQQGHDLAALGYVAFSINYRLAPEHPYPAAVDDVQAAVRWLRTPAQVERYGIDPERIGALGGSAGAHLTGMLATLGHGSLDHGARIRAAVSWSGPMDLRVAGATGPIPTFLGCIPSDPACADTAAAASPITYVDRTDAPLLLANSDHELVPLRQAQEMDAAITKAGVQHQLVVLPGTRHSRAYSNDIWDQTVTFFEQHLGSPKP